MNTQTTRYTIIFTGLIDASQYALEKILAGEAMPNKNFQIISAGRSGILENTENVLQTLITVDSSEADFAELMTAHLKRNHPSIVANIYDETQMGEELNG